jgi:hypothetical protein
LRKKQKPKKFNRWNNCQRYVDRIGLCNGSGGGVFNENLKKYQDVIAQIKKKDANESDIVTVITDILQDIFGYDKYADITSEYAIRGTYCDLAILDSHKKISFLIEVKAVSVALNDSHIKQALDYGSNAGVNWVLLTNAETSNAENMDDL